MQVLYISLGEHQLSLRKALDGLGEVTQLNWRKEPDVNRKIQELTRNGHQFDLCFFQLQAPGIIHPETLQGLTGFKVNWTGDVRTPLPRWYVDMAPLFNLTLFSNNHDVRIMKVMGLRAEFLPIGFEQQAFYPNGPKADAPDVVFMANNYGDRFPLSGFRRQVVDALYADKSIDFGVYGSGWPRKEGNLNSSYEAEAAVLRGCKIALSINHFDYSRYNSARLYRIMASGAFCLSHAYTDLEVDFTPGKHLDTFGSIDQLKEKIHYYLGHDKKRGQIAQAGCKLAFDKHTWQARMKQLMAYKQQYL